MTRDSTLTVCRSDVSVVKDGAESLCATALVTLMAMHGKPDSPPKPEKGEQGK